MSLADFLVIAAEAVMARSAKAFDKENPFQKGSLEDGFLQHWYYGRKTAETCDEHGLMPNPEKGCNDL